MFENAKNAMLFAPLEHNDDALENCLSYFTLQFCHQSVRLRARQEVVFVGKQYKAKLWTQWEIIFGKKCVTSTLNNVRIEWQSKENLHNC